MSITIGCCSLYGVALFIICIIFTSLSRNLFCPKLNTSITNSHNSSNHRLSLQVNHDLSSIHNRARSVSESAPNNIEEIILTQSSTKSSTLSNASTTSTSTTKLSCKYNSNTLNISTSTTTNESTEKSRSKSGSRHSRSSSFANLSNLPHAVTNVINNIKGILGKMEYRDYASNEIHLVVRLSSIISCFGFLISVTIICLYFLLNAAIQHSYGESILFNMKVMTFVCYALAKYALYICSLSRLYYSLDESIFQYGINIYALLVLYLILQLIITISSISSFCVDAYQEFIIFMIIFYFMDIAFLFILYILFIKQLLRLIKNTHAYIASSSLSKDNSNDDRNNNRNGVELQIVMSSPTNSPITENSDIPDLSNKPSSLNKSKTGQQTKSSLDISSKSYIGKHRSSGKSCIVSLYSSVQFCLLYTICCIFRNRICR